MGIGLTGSPVRRSTLKLQRKRSEGETECAWYSKQLAELLDQHDSYGMKRDALLQVLHPGASEGSTRFYPARISLRIGVRRRLTPLLLSSSRTIMTVAEQARGQCRAALVNLRWHADEACSDGRGRRMLAFSLLSAFKWPDQPHRHSPPLARAEASLPLTWRVAKALEILHRPSTRLSLSLVSSLSQVNNGAFLDLSEPPAGEAWPP